jgi:hypothetical protein
MLDAYESVLDTVCSARNRVPDETDRLITSTAYGN